MAMLPTCPTCGCHDGKQTVVCNNPWHADAHLRRAGRIKDAGLDIDKEAIERRRQHAIAAAEERPTTIRMRAETSRRCFEDALQRFVHHWAPTLPRQRDDFQHDLMMLFRDAMEHKSMTYGLHIERTESTLDALAMHATGALNVIFKEKK